MKDNRFPRIYCDEEVSHDYHFCLVECIRKVMKVLVKLENFKCNPSEIFLGRIVFILLNRLQMERKYISFTKLEKRKI